MRRLRRPVTAPRRDGTCFFEADPGLSLGRRAGAEAAGSFMLVFAAVAAGSVWTGAGALAPIGRALAVGPVLTGLILVFGQVSGGHYNPLISLAQAISRRRSLPCLLAYVVAQLLGATLAARAAIMAFGALPPPAPSAPMAQLLVFEAFATAGLMAIVLASPRIRPAGVGPFAVGGWIMMSIVALPAGPVANPAITFALLASGLAPLPGQALAHFVAQAAGLSMAALAIGLTAPRPGAQVSEPSSAKDRPWTA